MGSLSATQKRLETIRSFATKGEIHYVFGVRVVVVCVNDLHISSRAAESRALLAHRNIYGLQIEITMKVNQKM